MPQCAVRGAAAPSGTADCWPTLYRRRVPYVTLNQAMASGNEPVTVTEAASGCREELLLAVPLVSGWIADHLLPHRNFRQNRQCCGRRNFRCGRKILQGA
jgi:hypothetical protein